MKTFPFMLVSQICLLAFLTKQSIQNNKLNYQIYLLIFERINFTLSIGNSRD